jgi:hypothetical protein
MSTQPEKPDYDSVLKRLLLRAHDGFLSLVAPELSWQGERSPELRAVARQADLVWEVRAQDGQSGLLHVELQVEAKKDIGERVLEYAVRLWRRDHLPVRSVVVFLSRAGNIPQSPFVLDWMGQERLRFVFDVIRLWEIPRERVLETPYYDLWPLAALMADVTAQSVVDVAERIAGAPVTSGERDELAKSLVLFAGMSLPTEAVREAVRRAHMALNLWEHSNLKEVLAEMLNEQLIEESREAGREEGMRESIRLVLAARFGPLDEAMSGAIQRADEAALKDLLPHAATDTEEQLRQRLSVG